ncbi:pyruvate kinase [Prochlorococcus marinus]|uniref:Pyruvate kinase n=1 Tax=Prochlorococcus marinus (strain MIT 9211) TaxID=93059 RepID=A9BAB6_PROM4|nr:pyruvate kinase [Prochlorococcus marinus]ABX08778.1 Pyruvate kinase [Prochlorococcus marinus str. MIT 9211]
MTNIHFKRRTKIVATIGPATESKERITELVEAGATTFRLNFSHGDHSEHAKRIETIRLVEAKLGVKIGILQDLQGPKIRLGRFKDGPIRLNSGDKFVLTSKDVGCNNEIANVTYEKLVSEVSINKRILLDDGRVEMVVERVDKLEEKLHCKVVVGGMLSNNKGVNFPDVQLSINALTPKDKIDLSFGLSQSIDWVALSFVRNPDDIKEIKELIRSHGYTTPVVAKIEKFEAIDQIDAILRLCDGVMVARGDLGVEVPAEEVPLLQKELIKKSNSLGIPIITATQMLDSMASSPRPTRAEVSDVANAILDGTDAVMLSNETAVGDYPIEAVKTMATIAKRIEKDYPQRALESHLPSTIPNAISAAVSSISRQLNASAILPLTKSGSTAHNVSKFRPPTPIVAVTNETDVARRLQLVWGVTPIVIKEQETTTKTFNLAMEMAQGMGLLKPGALVVQTAGTITGVSGSTDLIKVGIVNDIVARGNSEGNNSVCGKVRIAKEQKDLSELKKGEILVLDKNINNYSQALKYAAGIILEGTLNIENNNTVPTIYNVKGATDILRDGDMVTLVLKEGTICRGEILND